MKPPKIILSAFLLLILVGALLLSLPIATRSGQRCAPGDALFTAVSAACVTGLVVQDTASFWSPFGQAVILLLIQAGGLGVVTVSVLFALLTGRRIGLRHRFLMQESISAPQMGGIVRLTCFLLVVTLTIELVGAALLSLRFCPQSGWKRGLWYAIFHSVSAFCNAGFDLMGTAEAPFASLTGFGGDFFVSSVIAFLIVAGGLGFFTYDDLRTCGFRFRRYHLQTKLILISTALLLFLPAVFFFFLEFSRPSWTGMDAGQMLLLSFFQSVTARTAGFNTAELSLFCPPSLALLCFLMLIGGSPSSTAGGIKTTSLAVLFLRARSAFSNHSEIQGFQRRIPFSILQAAVTIALLYLLLSLTAGFALCYLEEISLLSAIFESVSALGTVGLSLGLTPQLGLASRCILMLLMYLGRVGGLTLLYAVAQTHQMQSSHFPQEGVAVG